MSVVIIVMITTALFIIATHGFMMIWLFWWSWKLPLQTWTSWPSTDIAVICRHVSYYTHPEL